MHYLCHCNPCRCEGTGNKRGAAKPSNRKRCPGAGEVTEPPIGAHLVTPRYGYTHHGIYAGAGIVVHYSGLSRGLSSGPVEETSLARFANGQAVAIRCRGPMPFDTPEILRRARSRLGESRYRLLSNNCEHFSEWAQFGLSRSTQVDRWLQLPYFAAAFVVRRARVVLRSLSDRLPANHEGVADPG